MLPANDYRNSNHIMGGFNKPCLNCGQLSKGSRCPDCQGQLNRIRNRAQDTPERRAKKALYYNKDYHRRAKIVRDTATHCHLCGKGARANDPWQADHLDPGNPNSILLPAHRSCNASRGNKPLGG
jgi:hypothetical protein